MKPHKIIETKSASLDTLSVTIRALHVNGKQMTLAVFRQLPVASVYNENGSLAPMECWGLVRYAFEKNGAAVWVVGVKDGVLYRCPMRGGWQTTESAMSQLQQAEDCLAWWKSIDEQKTRNPHVYVSGHSGAWGCGPWRKEGLGQIERRIAEAKQYLDDCVRAEATLRALYSLPQLFIAV